MKLNAITLAVLLVVAVGLAQHWRAVQWTPARVVGAALCGVSLAMAMVARFQLGAAFSVRAKAQKLVTTGVYARIRNPIYVFGEVFFVGVALISGRWWVLVVGAAIVPVQMWRARNEARVLRAAFGEEYDKYRAQTWF